MLVDNRRTELLASEWHRWSLRCIRCGGCLNTCPVFRRSGGHSYGASIPGPIGSILAPFRDPEQYASLPYASSLCGSCTDVCPVQIDLHHQLLAWRAEIVERKLLPLPKRLVMRLAAAVMLRPTSYRLAGKTMRWMGRWLPGFFLRNRLNSWARQRELPPFPRRSFRELYSELMEGDRENDDEQPR